MKTGCEEMPVEASRGKAYTPSLGLVGSHLPHGHYHGQLDTHDHHLPAS